MRRLILEETTSPAALWCRRLVVMAVLVAAFGVLFGRFNFTDATSALAVLVFALFLALLSLAAAGFAFVQIWRDGVKGAAISTMSAFVALLLLSYPAFLAVRSLQLPRLNDIATDYESPPRFSESLRVLALRDGFQPPPLSKLGRPIVAAAYPNVKPLTLDTDVGEVFEASHKVLKALGWKILEESAPSQSHPDGEIEAITRSLFLGVPYHIAIRVAANGEASRVDLRALTRFGTHDYGHDAQLIERFNAALQAEIDSR